MSCTAGPGPVWAGPRGLQEGSLVRVVTLQRSPEPRRLEAQSAGEALLGR